MPLRLLFAVLATALLPTGITAQTRSAAPVTARTFRADSFWVQQWVRGGADEDDLLIEPRSVAVSGSVITVLDLGSREILGLDVTSGKTVFTKEARGSGPGEFKRPAMLVRAPQQFGVLDHDAARLSMFSTTGALVWDAPVSNIFDVESACALPGARVMLKTKGFEKSLSVIDSAGKHLGTYSLPRADPKADMPTFTESSDLAGPIRGDHCAVVPIFGARWFVVDARGTISAHPYVEPGETPVIEVSSTLLEKQGRDEVRRATQTTTTSPIASGALHRGDTLIVISGKSPKDRGRVLDYYTVPDGRYAYSRRLPMSFTSLTITTTGVLVGTVIGPDWSAVVALEPSRSAPSSKPKASVRR